jgi:drug/metabolite transporter (DMT)-like permease
LIGVVFFLVFAFDRQSLAAARGAPWSLAWAAAAGVAVAGAEIALYYAFSLPNSQVTVGSQLVNGLAIIVAAALAFIFVRGETVNWVKLTSGVLIAGGIVLLSLEKLLVP